jgi:transcriptional regulator with XRE-family HTH domain
MYREGRDDRVRVDTVCGIMTPGELIKAARERKGLSQRTLALRAGTSQSAIARIEGGKEEVTWKRLSNLLVAMGEQPVLSSKPLASEYDARETLEWRRMTPSERLERGMEINKRASVGRRRAG